MRTFWKEYFVAMVMALVLFNGLLAFADETAMANESAKESFNVDGLRYNPETKMFEWVDSYICDHRPGMEKWKLYSKIREHVKNIRTEANLSLLATSGDTREERMKLLNIDLPNQKLFDKAFCIEAQKNIVNRKGGCSTASWKFCAGNSDDYIFLVVRKIADGTKPYTTYIFSFISKKEAYELGCRDADVLEYVERKNKTKK